MRHVSKMTLKHCNISWVARTETMSNASDSLGDSVLHESFNDAEELLT